MRRGAVMRFSICALSGVLLMSSCRESEKKVSSVKAPVARSGESPVYDASRKGLSGHNAYVHVARLVGMGPRPVESAALQESVAFLEKQLQGYGWSTERQSFEADTPAGKKCFTNLRARLSKDFSARSAGILGCHIDTKLFPFPFVGANDGASHTAVLLEIARLMAQDAERWRGVELVFFDGEEAFRETMDGGSDGLYGSTYYAGHLSGEQLPDWMLNADMLGASLLKVAIPADTHPALYALYGKVREELGESERVFGVAEGAILDDHVPFQDRGVPVLNLIGDFSEGAWWHTRRDSLEMISPASLERSGRFLWRLLEYLVPAPVKKAAERPE